MPTAGTYWGILVSFAVALILTMMPLPGWGAHFRPEWAALTLIYWIIALPRQVGIGVAWTVGLLVDVVKGALLGQYALGFALTAYLCIRLHERLRVFPVWQQAMMAAALLVPYLVWILWSNGISGQPVDSWLFWGPLISSAALWPWVFVLLRDVRRRTVGAQ
ncbi:MAG: rod shape-determining protein MreD [Gammaproteobacteria bacterium]